MVEKKYGEQKKESVRSRLVPETLARSLASWRRR